MFFPAFCITSLAPSSSRVSRPKSPVPHLKSPCDPDGFPAAVSLPAQQGSAPHGWLRAGVNWAHTRLTQLSGRKAVCISPIRKNPLFSSQIKPAFSIWVGKREALEAVPGITVSSPAWPAPGRSLAAALPPHSDPLHPCRCSCCDFGFHMWQGQARCLKNCKSQVASGRPEASAGQQMLLVPSVAQDGFQGPQEYWFASWPQAQAGSLDAAVMWLSINTDYRFLLRTLSLHPVCVFFFSRTAFSRYAASRCTLPCAVI